MRTAVASSKEGEMQNPPQIAHGKKSHPHPEIAYIILRGGGTAADDDLELKRSLKMRYFTPREVARLMGFPEAPEFTFPDTCANILCYRLLGNSLNVTVVSTLLEHLFAT